MKRKCNWPGCTATTEQWVQDGWCSCCPLDTAAPGDWYLCPQHGEAYEEVACGAAERPRSLWAEKRFVIHKDYEGPPVEFRARGGVVTVTEGQGLVSTVEQYDDEFTARVRVAVLNHGLKKKKYTLWEQVEEGDFVEVEDTDVDDEEEEEGVS
jgi:hypothetical protein